MMNLRLWLYEMHSSLPEKVKNVVSSSEDRGEIACRAAICYLKGAAS